MTDQSESESEPMKPAVVVRKGKGGPSQPSFDDILAGKPAEPPRPPPQPKSEPPPPPRPPAQPSFDDILAKAAPSADDKAAADAQPRREERTDRGPRQAKRDQKRMPIVVRKLALGETAQPPQAGPSGSSAQGQSEQGAGGSTPETDAATREADKGSEGSNEGPGRQQRQRREPKPQQPMAESMFATPSAEEDGDFAALLAETPSGKREKLKAGSRVHAKVAHLGAEVAFLDLGGKGEGIIDLRELRNDKGEMVVNVGETIDGYVLSLGGPDAGIVITRSVPKGAGRDLLAAAMEARLPVEGTVTGQNKGGLEVELGGLRAFVPASQVDIRFVEDQSQFVGQKLKFLIVELRGGNAVLSRRALLEEERKGQAAELRKTLEVGAALDGVITGVRDFGAFVDLGGLEGLIHVSELSHQRVAHAQDVVKVGQKVRVQVLRIEPAAKDDKHGGQSEKIGLSLRALEQDPFDAHVAELTEGTKLQGKVLRLQPFGAFVELFPGLDGLVHVSALSNKHVTHPREVVKEGEVIWVQVESVDPAQRRVSLRRITEEEAQTDGPVPAPQRGGHREPREPRAEGGEKSGAPAARRARVGDVVDAVVDRCEVYGVFVSWTGPTAGRGLVPNQELGTPRGSDNKKVMPIGTAFKASIIDLDDKGRYRLSKVAVEAAIERAEMDEYHRSVKKPSGKGFGTLGDLLRAKLGKE